MVRAGVGLHPRVGSQEWSPCDPVWGVRSGSHATPWVTLRGSGAADAGPERAERILRMDRL